MSFSQSVSSNVESDDLNDPNHPNDVIDPNDSNDLNDRNDWMTECSADDKPYGIFLVRTSLIMHEDCNWKECHDVACSHDDSVHWSWVC